MAVSTRPKFDFIPAMVGTGAGLTAGVLRQYGSSLPAWRMGVFSSALIGLGVAGHFFDWNNDLSYGLQISGAYGLAERIAPAIAAKSPKAVFEDIAVLDEAGGTRALRAARARRGDIAVLEEAGGTVSPAISHAGCSSCAAAALRNPEAVHNGSGAAHRGDVVADGPRYPDSGSLPRMEAVGIL